MNKGKILITGTGRCGTTFLIILMTYLKLDTGFSINNYVNNLFKNCNSGMELDINAAPQYLKNPRFITDMANISKRQDIKYIIIPIRNYEQSAKSRVKHGVGQAGGLWQANNYDQQLQMYHKIMAEYLLYMVKYNIPTIFLDFEQMVQDSQYLYDMLKPVLADINYEQFNEAYNLATEQQKRK